MKRCFPFRLRFYGNESALGEAVQILMTERGVKREEITITTKVEAVVVTYEKVRDKYRGPRFGINAGERKQKPI